MNTARCRSCSAEIIWAETVNGKKIPLDAKPERRFVTKGHRTHNGQINTLVEIVETYQTHFASCAYAAQHRKGD
jgi:hypothetical protein